MKIRVFADSSLRFFVIPLLAATWLALVSAVNAEEPNPDRMRKESEKLEQLAQKLKTDGNHEKAMQVMREAEELETHAKRMERSERSEPRELARHREELNTALGNLRHELQELSKAGKMDAAARVKEEIHEVERELMLGNQRVVREGEIHRDHPVDPHAPPPRPEGEERERRMRHLNVAIENLHAAGLHEVAERLMERVKEMHREMQERPRPNCPGCGEMERGFDRLRGEMRELHHAIAEMREQMERIQRELR